MVDKPSVRLTRGVCKGDIARRARAAGFVSSAGLSDACPVECGLPENLTVIRPFYFGPDGRRLFAVYHPPQATPTMPIGVLLCNPVGFERARMIRSFACLASELAQRGFAVLRFDYFGTGDSAGTPEMVDAEQWVSDVGAAADALRRAAGTLRLSVIGQRFGANLGAVASSRRSDIEGVGMWDPIPRSGDYLTELWDAHRVWLGREHGEGRRPPQRSGEVVGFLVTEGMAQSIERLDLDRLDRSPARQILIYEGYREPRAAPLAEYYRRLGGTVEYRHHPCDPVPYREVGRIQRPAIESLKQWVGGLQV